MDESVIPDEGNQVHSQEPKYNDIQMNDAIKKARQREYERARRELEAGMAQQQAQVQPPMPNQGVGGMPQSFDQNQFMSEMGDMMMQKLQKQVEEQEKREREAHAQKEYEAFLNKMKTGKERYSDFEETVKDFDVNSWPDVAALAHEFENTSDIIYDITKNPRKLADLDSYLRRGDRKLAKQQMKLLSDSITDNIKAKEEQVIPQEPLNRLKSSPGAGATSGQMSLKDFKRASWLKA